MVALFKSSKTSISPIQVMINEIPKEKRARNVILCGVWVGDTKPKVHVYL